MSTLDDSVPDLMAEAQVISLAARPRDEDDPESVTPKPMLDMELGVEQNLPFSTPYGDGSKAEVHRDESDGPSVAQLVAMRRTDGQARALYRLITLPIRSALKNATFVPGEEGGGTEEADFIKAMFTLPPHSGGMTTTFQRFMAEMMSAIFDGFSAFEQVYTVPKKGPLKGKITLEKLARRPAETVTFLTDDHGGFAGLRQRATLHGKTIDVEIAPENAVYYACQEEERAFYGVSLFQSAFYHYDKKVKLYFIAHLAAQRAAVGTRKGVIPKTASLNEKRSFIRALADLGVAQHIAVPEGFDVEILSEGGSFDFLSWVNHHNSQMSKSVLAAFFDSNEGGGASDTSLVNFGESSDAMFLLMLQTIMDEMAEVINQHIIPKFIDWNFASGNYPTFQWGTFTDEQRAAIAKTFETLAVAAAPNVSQEFLWELEKKRADELGLEIDWEVVDERRQAELERNEAQAEAFASQQDAAAQMAQAEMGMMGQQQPGEGGTPTPGAPGTPPAPGSTPATKATKPTKASSGTS